MPSKKNRRGNRHLCPLLLPRLLLLLRLLLPPGNQLNAQPGTNVPGNGVTTSGSSLVVATPLTAPPPTSGAGLTYPPSVGPPLPNLLPLIVPRLSRLITLRNEILSNTSDFLGAVAFHQPFDIPPENAFSRDVVVTRQREDHVFAWNALFSGGRTPSLYVFDSLDLQLPQYSYWADFTQNDPNFHFFDWRSTFDAAWGTTQFNVPLVPFFRCDGSVRHLFGPVWSIRRGDERLVVVQDYRRPHRFYPLISFQDHDEYVFATLHLRMVWYIVRFPSDAFQFLHLW